LERLRGIRHGSDLGHEAVHLAEENLALGRQPALVEGIGPEVGAGHEQQHCEQYVLHRAMLFGLLLYRELDPRGRTAAARRGLR
jgi:hypothetical protein